MGGETPPFSSRHNRPLSDVSSKTGLVLPSRATYEMAMREVSQDLHSALPNTIVWGYGDGVSGASFPGPTLETSTGAPITVYWINDLRDTSQTGDPLRTEHGATALGSIGPGQAPAPKYVGTQHIFLRIVNDGMVYAPKKELYALGQGKVGKPQGHLMGKRRWRPSVPYAGLAFKAV